MAKLIPCKDVLCDSSNQTSGVKANWVGVSLDVGSELKELGSEFWDLGEYEP